MRGKNFVRADVVETLKRTENFKSFLLDVNDIRGHAHIVTMLYDTKCILRSQFSLPLRIKRKIKFTVKWPKSVSCWLFFLTIFFFLVWKFNLNNKRRNFFMLFGLEKFIKICTIVLFMLHFCPKITNLFCVPTFKQLTQ